MSVVAKSFSAAALTYDDQARIQPLVAAKLAAKLGGKPARILEIGCGTGGLSLHLARLFSDAELVVTDIALPMLDLCQQRLGKRASFRLMNGEWPAAELGKFDLIVSSLAMQWFDDLPGSISRLANMLKPGGRLAFAILGRENFPEWRALLAEHNAEAGIHEYHDAASFPWPAGYTGEIEEELIKESHISGVAFLKALKAIGAGMPRAEHEPISPVKMRRILAASADGFAVTYHILYGNLTVRYS